MANTIGQPHAAAQAGIYVAGFPWKTVRVEEVGFPIALVIDEFGKEERLRIDIMRGKAQPMPNEFWLIDRSLGYWTFAAILQHEPPEVTGSCNSVPALISLCAALGNAGFIVNHTTP